MDGGGWKWKWRELDRDGLEVDGGGWKWISWMEERWRCMEEDGRRWKKVDRCGHGDG